jgi:hypothetical protein
MAAERPGPSGGAGAGTVAFVLECMARLETARAPDAVRAAVRALQEGGVEPHRTVVRRALQRLRALGAREGTP